MVNYLLTRLPVYLFTRLRVYPFTHLPIYSFTRLLVQRFMQNKPNFRKAKMNISSALTKDYEYEPHLRTASKQTQSNPIFEIPVF